MNIDLIGRIKNTKLAARHGLMPLYEAAVNSIMAIEESQRADGYIRIAIERDLKQSELDLHGNTIAPVEAFVIEDNGIGFTESNFRSFETMDSQEKAARGAKGIGRLLWLKAFAYAEIESTYREDDQWYHRTFVFRPTQIGIENHHKAIVDTHGATPDCKTIIKLISFKPRYRDCAPKSIESIGRRIVEHCMEYFLLKRIPAMTAHDIINDDEIDLIKLFEEEYRPESTSREFKVRDVPLSITDVLIRAGADTQHRVYLCAHKRTVESISLAGKIPHLDGTVTNQDGNPAVYAGYVTGQFLDERVDAERTSFNIDNEDRLPFIDGPTYEDLKSSTIASVSEYLKPLTEEIQKQSIERIRTFIEKDEPKYRPLLSHRFGEIEKLSGNISNTALDLELHKILNDWRHEVKKRLSERLETADADSTEFERFREEFRRILGELQEVAKSDLADYVIHWAAILSYFEKLLGKGDDDKYAHEDALHGLFFPQRKTSDEIDYDEHSLWLIDERLAYHRYLASDIPFKKHDGPVQVDSDDRPDLLIFNNPIAFTPGEEPYSSIVVIEFKRPERKDQKGEDSPIAQVLRYVRQIRDGKGKRSDGSTIELPIHTPFYCYVVATLTPSLKEEAEERSFTESPDGMGYFTYNSPYKAYIEISSYRKILSDAKKRNKAFFDRLQINVK